MHKLDNVIFDNIVSTFYNRSAITDRSNKKIPSLE